MSGMSGSRRGALRVAQRFVVRFVARHGWRAYALPVLAVVTVLALASGTHASARRHPTAAAGTPRSASTVPAGAAGSPADREQAAPSLGFDLRAAVPSPSASPPVSIDLGSDSGQCASNTSGTLILVSVSQQHLWACDGSVQVNETAVTTGKTVGGDQTPLGSWTVQGKQRDRDLVGPGYREFVHFWVPFNGDFGLHDAPWQTMPFGSPQWRTRGSHGCVHTPERTMAWLYRWAVVGQTVVTVTR